MNRYPYAEQSARAGVEIGNVKFKKTGSEIQTAIDARLVVLGAKVKASQEKIAVICKARELDVHEVLAADTEEKVGTYSTKAYSNAPKANAVIVALQEDLNTLRQETDLIWATNRTIEDLAKVKKNIEPGRDFDLYFHEVQTLGF